MDSVEHALVELRQYHRMGELSLHPSSRLSQNDQRLLARFASLNPDTQRKVSNFAFAKNGYSKLDLNKLIDLCQRHDFALGFSLIERLLSIPKEDRWNVQKMTVEGRWSRRDIDLLIKTRYGVRARGGRRPKAFSTPESLRAGIASACLGWLRQRENIERVNADVLVELPFQAIQLYKQATTAIRKLHRELMQFENNA